MLGALAALLVACSASVESSPDETDETSIDPPAARGEFATPAGRVGAADAGPDAATGGCDDGDPCTLDEHPPGYCVHTPICGGQTGAGSGQGGHAS